ncbi:MAG: DUF695 domain-containing protein [Planctomycetota bacterium]
MTAPDWLGSTVEYEGLPLALRVRPGIESSFETFPDLGELTHLLSDVKPNGLPRPDYNKSLMDFDEAVHELLEANALGKMMIVETFGGRRAYYACVKNEAAHRAWCDSVRQQYPEHELQSRFRFDRAASFYRKYRAEFGW